MRGILFFLNLTALCFALDSAKPIISVSTPPQSYFVKKIAGESVEVNVLIPPNTDEHNFDFKPQTMINLEKSAVYFVGDLEFESQLVQRLESTKVKKVRLNAQDTLKGDPHTWLDPILVKEQAKVIAQTLSELYPQNRAFYEKNLAVFLGEIDILDSQIRALLSGLESKKFIVYHPSWGHFASRYNLEQVAIEVDGKEPKPRELAAITKTAKKENIPIIFVQVGFPQVVVLNLVKEWRVEAVSIDYLSANWASDLLYTAQILHNALK
ncbi:metal ABC transporter solute-binding protein, Zn/Mn family [Helicobacter sp. MIT 00-7814]|uniref:metal ABC transporter solute-binding protein, Zn/Mn family n=1 Tax=Helicobacter sp. MIT 00-7814 TaxID=2040650 RepID=UPI002161E4D4|nr:zinc ABC transporter substrate-binding protein [Helicobacter sp. MIT 00-7814]